MLKKPLPGPTRYLLGAGLAVLTSSAAATVVWQQQPATVITLPAIALVASPAAMPPLPALGRVRVPYPEPVLPAVFAGAPALAATAAPAAAVAPEASVARAPLTLPTPRAFAEPADRIPLPPPPTPRGEISAPEPQVSLAGRADPATEATDYVPPRVLVAVPAKLPRGARVPQPQVTAVADGEVLRDERVLRPAGRKAYVPRDALVANGLVLQVELDARGKLVDAKVHENLLGSIYARNALAAIKRWRFEPARRAGLAEPSTVLVPVWFEWNDGGIEAMKRDQMSHPKPTYQPPPQPIAGQ